MAPSDDSRRPPRWFRTLLYGFVVVLLVPVWAGIRLVQAGATIPGVGVVAVGLVTVALWIRSIRRDTDRTVLVSSDISQEGVDYLVWTALGVPFILIGLLLIWLMAGGRAGT
jgi:hypothetical protein